MKLLKPLRAIKQDYMPGSHTTDHMLEINFDKRSYGWGAPTIVPYQSIPMSRACTCFHYGISTSE